MSRPESTAARALAALRELHGQVDSKAAEIAAGHGERIRCRRGCAACCVDDLTVFEIEAERIREGAASLLQTGEAGPLSACAFLDPEGACRIYSVRPYVCRTQGLPLRWIEEAEETEQAGEPDGAVVESRDICPLNDQTGEPLEQLSPEQCWTLGPVEDRLRALQQSFGGSLKRVPLRSLFERGREKA